MNKKIMTAAILATCAGGALARFAVTIYGIAEVGLVRESGDANYENIEGRCLGGAQRGND